MGVIKIMKLKTPPKRSRERERERKSERASEIEVEYDFHMLIVRIIRFIDTHRGT